MIDVILIKRQKHFNFKTPIRLFEGYLYNFPNDKIPSRKINIADKLNFLSDNIF